MKTREHFWRFTEGRGCLLRSTTTPNKTRRIGWYEAILQGIGTQEEEPQSMSPSKTASLTLTSQERMALSIALKTTLRLWGDSEDQAQERVRGKLESVVRKLDALPQ
jgi:hypothetical protein